MTRITTITAAWSTRRPITPSPFPSIASPPPWASLSLFPSWFTLCPISLRLPPSLSPFTSSLPVSPLLLRPSLSSLTLSLPVSSCPLPYSLFLFLNSCFVLCSFPFLPFISHFSPPLCLFSLYFPLPPLFSSPWLPLSFIYIFPFSIRLSLLYLP